MLTFIMTILLMILGVGVCLLSFITNCTLIASDAETYNVEIPRLGSLLAVTVFFSNPNIFEGVADAYTLGGVWSSEYVMHIPRSYEFWSFFGSFLKSWFVPSQYSVIGIILFSAIAFGLYKYFLNILKLVKRGDTFPDGRKDLFGSFSITLASLITISFIAPYVLGTLMFLTDWWWAVLIVIMMGAGGGGTRIYNKDGRRIGTFYE